MENTLQKLNLKIPRTKFRFKKKSEIQAKQKKRVDNDVEKQDEFVKTIKGLVDLKDQTLTLTQKDLDSNFKLVNLDNCTIKMEGQINMLFLRDLKNCEIHTCPVSNSIMGHYLNDCKISLIGHQVILPKI
jgi:glycine cleavage system protein P-like pyridoxal-binding family